MRTALYRTCLVLVVFSATARAAENPKKISIGPKNDLSTIEYTPPGGFGYGSSVSGYNLSKEYEEGYRIGSKNDHYGKRNKLIIDDGKSTFPATDKETGLPIVILTEVKNTKELQDLVRGYNAAMQRAFEQRKKKTEQAVTPNGP